MTEQTRNAGIAASVLLLVGAFGSPLLAGEKDATLDNTERLLTRTLRDITENPLAKTRESGLVITALRSTKDVDLLPFFNRIRESKDLENQIYGMIACAVMAKDSKKIDLPMLYKSNDPSLVGSAIATLIDSEVITQAQLESIAADAPEDVQKCMALSELAHRKVLKDKDALVKLLKSGTMEVRYYSAITLLTVPDAPETAAALAALKDMSDKNDLHQAPIQAMMILRVQKDKIAAAGPWLVQIASDEKNDEGLRFTAAAALLSLKHPDGPTIVADMIQKQHDTIQQVKLGLIALEYGSDFKPAALAPLLQSRSPLAKAIATMAQEGTTQNPADGTTGLVNLMKEGHPIVLNWALTYSEHADADRKMAIRAAIINQATIVDDARGQDYERAALAAQRVLEDGGPAGRKLLASLIKGDNHAVAEAVLAGIYRATATDESELVLPAWEALSRSTTEETAANYAALILAREGKMQSLAWLSGMVMGGTVQSQGFRAIAGWYYAKLLNQSGPLLQHVLAEQKTGG